jgi:hypothetical protein
MVTWWTLYIYFLLMFCGGVALYAVVKGDVTDV